MCYNKSSFEIQISWKGENTVIHSMTKAEVEKAGALLIDTLKEGEVLYPSILLRGTKEKMKKFLLQVIEEQDCYADFYYSSLKKEEKEHFLSGLSADGKIICTAHGMYGGKDILSAGQ